ncbi:hypothetical protein LP418_01910 [Nocardioides sp. B-3]|nr:hypothetical protein [Nocardioides sp. B-3]UUZ59847.1 hypothetical protein LP418_01910 [Nocardioides sp. B-3]
MTRAGRAGDRHGERERRGGHRHGDAAGAVLLLLVVDRIAQPSRVTDGGKQLVNRAERVGRTPRKLGARRECRHLVVGQEGQQCFAHGRAVRHRPAMHLGRAAH